MKCIKWLVQCWVCGKNFDCQGVVVKRVLRVRVGNLVFVFGIIIQFIYWFFGDEEVGLRDMLVEVRLEKG